MRLAFDRTIRWLVVIVAATAAGNCGQARRAQHDSDNLQTQPEALPPEWRAQHDSDYLRTHRDSLRRVIGAESTDATRGGPQPDRSVGEYGDFRASCTTTAIGRAER